MKKCFIDYDCVLYDLQSTVIKKVKKDYGVTLSYSDIKYWNFVIEKFPISANVYTDLEHYSKGVHFDGSVDFMNTLYDIFGKENVYIITDSHPSLIKSKDEEIFNIYGTTNVIHEAYKHLVTGDNFLCDDSIDNIINHVSHNEKGIGFIFDYEGLYGWNKNPMENRSERIFRKTSYEEVIKHILEQKQK